MANLCDMSVNCNKHLWYILDLKDNLVWLAKKRAESSLVTKNISTKTFHQKIIYRSVRLPLSSSCLSCTASEQSFRFSDPKKTLNNLSFKHDNIMEIVATATSSKLRKCQEHFRAQLPSNMLPSRYLSVTLLNINTY